MPRGNFDFDKQSYCRKNCTNLCYSTAIHSIHLTVNNILVYLFIVLSFYTHPLFYNIHYSIFISIYYNSSSYTLYPLAIHPQCFQFIFSSFHFLHIKIVFLYRFLSVPFVCPADYWLVSSCRRSRRTRRTPSAAQSPLVRWTEYWCQEPKQTYRLYFQQHSHCEGDKQDTDARNLTPNTDITTVHYFSCAMINRDNMNHVYILTSMLNIHTAKV